MGNASNKNSKTNLVYRSEKNGKKGRSSSNSRAGDARSTPVDQYLDLRFAAKERP